MYTVKKNGRTVAIVDADDMQVDATGENVVLVFTKGNEEMRITEENDGENTPYWQPINQE